jgi:hypothetical protein
LDFTAENAEKNYFAFSSLLTLKFLLLQKKTGDSPDEGDKPDKKEKYPLYPQYPVYPLFF